MNRSYLLYATVFITTFLPGVIFGYESFGYHDRINSSGSLDIHTGSTESGYYLRVKSTGNNPENIQIFPSGRFLVIQLAQGNQYESRSPGYRESSHWQMSFRKKLRIPHDADRQRMTKKIRNGNLEVYLPRKSLYTPAAPYWRQ